MHPLQPRPESLANRSVHILLVEDHQATLDVMSRLLKRAGSEVTSASTVGDALRAASLNRFDIVVSDLGLPDGTGTDLLQQLRNSYGLRGIALSGYGMEEDLVRSRKAGFATHLTKPVDFHQLEHVLRDLAHGGMAEEAR